MNDIHDIKPLIKPIVNPAVFYYLIGALVIIALLAAGFYFWKKRKKMIKQKAVVLLTPDEAAFQSLDELTDVENQDGKDFYFRLSAILRAYIQGRYGINAPDMTTEELIPRIEGLEIPRELKQDVKDLCRSTDPVKFAGIPAIQAKMLEDLKFVRNFVKYTTPPKITENKS